MTFSSITENLRYAKNTQNFFQNFQYRHKLRESQSNRVFTQKQSLSQKQEEAIRIDRRIAELQERLHRKQVLNSQIVATFKQQVLYLLFNTIVYLPIVCMFFLFVMNFTDISVHMNQYVVVPHKRQLDYFIVLMTTY